MRKLYIIFFVSIILVVTATRIWAVTVSVRVNGSNNDAEERISDGDMYRNSTDLEFAYDRGGLQITGMRFQNVAIPQGATINNAYLEFETDETDSGATNLVIYGEDADNPNVFANNDNNISSRNQTSASVNWAPTAWNTVNQLHQTPGISTIIQEIVDRTGWSSGNNMVIMIGPGAGCVDTNCQRTAESFNGEANAAPLLVVDYSLNGVTCETYRDNFQTVSYGNQDGTSNWASNWVETNDNGQPNSGDIRIVGGQLEVKDNDRVITRGADLSSYSSATLTFNYQETGFDNNNDYVDIEIRGGANGWTSLRQFAGPSINSGSANIVIPQTYLVNNTEVRLITSGSLGNNDRFRVDNFQIEACSSGAPTVDLLTTTDTTPVMTGTFNSTNSAGGFTVTLNVVTYTLGSSLELTNSGDDWTLDLSAISPLSAGTYEVVATSDDGAGTVLTDSTSDELIIIGPLSEWRMDETAWSGIAGEVLDSSGNGLHGQSISGATPLPARICNGASLNGTSAYIEVADHALLDIADELTVTAWIRPSSIPASGLMSIISKDENYEFHINAAGQIFWWWGGGALVLTTTGVPLSGGNWYHVAIVYSDANNTQTIYINGVTRGTNNQSGALTLNNDPFQIGGDQGYAGREFDGLIDEVRVYHQALTMAQVNTVMNDTRVCPSSGPDHYSISHSGIGVTCEAIAVQITAHDVSDVAMAPDSSTSITLSTSIANDGWALRTGNGSFTSPNQYTFDGIETSVEFWLTKITATTAPHMDIDVTDGSATDPDDGGTEDEVLEFRDTAFLFNTINAQIAGKSSNINPGSQSLTLRAIQTNTTTGACEARLSGPQTIEMGFECINPDSCQINNGVTIIDDTIGGSGDTLNDNPLGGPITYSNVNLTFDGFGTATWSLNYLDAGQITLHANKTIPASGEDPEDTLSGSSDPFASIPAGLCVSSADTNADCVSGDASCTGFRGTGEDFNLEIKAVAWQTAGESDTDFCVGNAVTPNFRLTNINLGHNLIAPTPIGTAGTINVSAFDMSATDNGVHNIANQNASEVGVFSFVATAPDYFSATIAASTSANIGRFYPDHFVLENLLLTNRSILAPCSSTFTYMDENFQVSYDLSARNAGGDITQNYTTASGFAKLDSTELNYGAVDLSGPTDLTTRVSVTIPNLDFISGVAAGQTDTLTLDRLTTGPDGPYSLTIGIAPQDDDTVQLNVLDLDVDGDAVDDHGVLGDTTIYYGLLSIDNAHGSELLPLTVGIRTLYFDSSTGTLIPNGVDNCTAYDVIAIDLAGAGYTSPLTATDLGLTGNGVLTGGTATFNLHDDVDTSAGPGVTGDVNYTMTVPGYLQFDWDGNALFTDNPNALATFGIYSGSDWQIYQRQIYQ